MKNNLELYLHIPFCVQKCAYCDFLSGPAGAEEITAYVDALVCEIRTYQRYKKSHCVSTVFFGGGTPSILEPEQILSIMRVLRETFDIEERAEITVEVNPGTMTREKAACYKAIGINRISIGLQSVNNEELKLLGRIHTFEVFEETYRILREEGFDNISVDLISAIPGQTCSTWEKSLSTVVKLHPEHISAYSLIIEEGTPFYNQYGPGHTAEEHMLPSEEEEREIYYKTEDILKRAGYVRYEISNYARPGYECRHNIGYWERTEYLGLGVGASSLIGETRYRNYSGLAAYRNAVARGESTYEETETLTENAQMEEMMFLGLRMKKGISLETFEAKFNRSLKEVYGKVIDKFLDEGFLKQEGTQMALTDSGIDVSNAVLAEFLL